MLSGPPNFFPLHSFTLPRIRSQNEDIVCCTPCMEYIYITLLHSRRKLFYSVKGLLFLVSHRLLYV